VSAVSFTIGDRAPAIFGATADGRFYSLDLQAGRPAVIVALGALEADAARGVLDRIAAAKGALDAAGVDAVPLAPAAAPFALAFAADPQTRGQVVYAGEAGGLDALTIDGAPAAIVIDRGGRIVDLSAFGAQADLAEVCRRVAALVASDPAHRRQSAAPALIIPNVASADFCRTLIAHFEASPHAAGVMASFSDGGAYAKLDESKKKRRDIELAAGDPLHAQVLEMLAARVVPEIKRAFQKDIALVDRILIARYDDTGGYFTRHRDNAAPQTAFREFAISLNLNTPDYEGGELLFPEYDDHRYSPPAGGAIVFSASLLHEAAPVTKGSRYVLLSFLCGAGAQAAMSGGE
jgi:predicted 2-oxoglutarate/Fe(II)-dependent dioxygenase YbiX